DDVRRFDIGHLMVAGFYARPKTLQGKVRRIDQDVWKEAVDALKKADQLNPRLSLVKANLGIAELIRPEGKDPAAALKLLDQALELAARDKELIAINYASILVNHSVAAGAAGQKEKMAASLDKAEALLSKMLSTPVRNASPEQRSKIFAEY